MRIIWAVTQSHDGSHLDIPLNSPDCEVEAFEMEVLEMDWGGVGNCDGVWMLSPA